MMTSAEVPLAQVLAVEPWNAIVVGLAVSGTFAEGDTAMPVRTVAPETSSVASRSAVCGIDVLPARTRIVAVPVASVVASAVGARVSVLPFADVMMPTGPETTLKRTSRPASGTPACESLTLTVASPPAQMAAPQLAGWLGFGVTVTTLLIVCGFTVTAEDTVVECNASVTESVTPVSVPTSPGTTITLL